MSRSSAIVTGPIAVHDRSRVAEILRSTENFRAEEINVALELFDESFVDSDYTFVGGFELGDWN